MKTVNIMPDAIDELVQRSKPDVDGRLARFHALHRTHPEILDFLIAEIEARLAAGLKRFSIGSLWDYARWKLIIDAGPDPTYQMNDHAAPYYGRAIVVLHPEFNGLVEFRASKVDEVFGLRHAPKKLATDYSRRLEWEDGTPLELGWRPSRPHVVKHAAKKRRDVHAR